jgi:tRNA-splicing ligase RtcB (3'-phosphate/5'-hydroxy nucleic acid ligase)
MKEKIYAKVDERTMQQFLDCMKEEFVIDGALMPDAHLGYVAPIGSVLVTKDFIVPSWVGYDIGCGVIAVKLKGKNLLKKIEGKKKEIFEKVNSRVPMGLGKLRAEHELSEEGKKEFEKILEKLEKAKINKKLFSWIKRKAKSNLGTLGHGNHFIEIDFEGKEIWLIVHSGSRNIGHKCAGQYMKKAMKEALLSNSENTASSARGGTGDGNEERTFALKANSAIGKEYLAVQDFCLELALLNRKEIAKTIINEIQDVLEEKIESELWTNKNHNHVVKEKGKWIHRKGATPSKKNEKGVIPGNMRDGTFLVIGKGNKDFLHSSSHGAGRAMSKRQAKESIDMKDFEKEMKGIIASVRKETIDESPKAYKNIFDVMNAQKKSVKIFKHLKPIINWKGY